MCGNTDEALDVLAKTSLLASAAIDNNALVPSEWMCIEWTQELPSVEADTQRVLDQLSRIMDLLSNDSQ